MIWPQYTRTLKHRFDLAGLKRGDRFIGCLKCGYRLSPDVKAAVLECPNCLGQMTDFYVTPEDVEDRGK